MDAPERTADARGGSRRSFLAAAGAAAAGIVGTAGCLGASGRVRVLAAGSLAVAFEDGVGPAFRDETGISIEGEYHGSRVVMRMVEDEIKRPDVLVSADVDLLRERLYGRAIDWDVEFAANEVGIAYNPDTDLGARLEDGEPWDEVLLAADENEIAISDPELGPLGYRSVLLFELAGRRYGREGFRETMVERAFTAPNELQLLPGVEAGERACALAYRNMADDHGIPFRRLDDAYNFGSSEHADEYAEATYRTDDGTAIEGSPTAYNASVLEDADNPAGGRELVAFLLEKSSLLEAHGLRAGDAVQRGYGDLPEGIES